MSCLNCPQTEKILDVETKLYNGFGGYSLYKNGNFFWSEKIDKDYEKCFDVNDIEHNFIRNESDALAKWEIKLDLPLRSAVWERKEKGRWVLTEKGLGFA